MAQVASDIERVTEANRRFYEAFSSLDIQQMEKVWETSQRVMCVHPGWSPLTGWRPIRASWQAIFENASLIHVDITDVDVEVEGDCAWVTCLEDMTIEGEGTANQYGVEATNIFARSGDVWLIIHRHAPA